MNERYRKRIRHVWTIVAVALIVLFISACGSDDRQEPAAEQSASESVSQESAAEAAEPLKVAFVYSASIGDLGWTWASDQGRLYLEEQLQDGVETAFIENVPEGPDAERVIRDFAQKGFDLIITTTFGYMDSTLTVAREFPDTHFVHVSGFKTAENMSTLYGRMYQPRYLSGLVAGSMTESDIIGYVAAFPISGVIRGINAFTLGVRAVNADAEVRVVWTNTWFGPPEEKEASEALLDQGADIIAQHQDTTEPQKAAAERGGHSIGYHSDMRAFVGDTVLTGPVWNWGPAFLMFAELVRDDAWESQQVWVGMEDNLVALADFSPSVPAEVATLVAEKQAAIIAGESDVFCGALTGQNGVVFLPAGQCMTDGQMLGMDWFVEGVVGDAPNDAAPIDGAPMPASASAPADAGALSGDVSEVAFISLLPSFLSAGAVLQLDIWIPVRM